MYGWDPKFGPTLQHWSTTLLRALGVLFLAGGLGLAAGHPPDWPIAVAGVVGFVQAFAFATLVDHVVWYVERKAREELEKEGAAARSGEPPALSPA